jgi:hypothetical protein
MTGALMGFEIFFQVGGRQQVWALVEAVDLPAGSLKQLVDIDRIHPTLVEGIVVLCSSPVWICSKAC